MLLVVLSIIGTVAVVIGIPATILQARSAIRQGRKEQADHDKELHAEGYAEGHRHGRQDGYNDGFVHGRREGFDAGTASKEAEIRDLRTQVETLTDDRNYWRGLRGTGTDQRSQGGGDGRN
jgi:type II secretory pathway pseudopilin PulG